MRVQPMPGVSVDIGEDGSLELRLDTAGRPRSYRCSPVRTAMWIALRQHDGDPAAAARILARQWGTALVDTRADLDRWVAELRDAGLARPAP
ncbi:MULTISPECIES: PqqD family protein [unclassified Streptomyces]|uniref:PqqD family protein n=1 Tax=unclassified Streptomyces TaxID=2593676 RepID=UPI00344B310A